MKALAGMVRTQAQTMFLGVDLLAVDQRDEGLVQGLVDVARDAVRGPLGLIDLEVVLLAQARIRVVFHQLGESTRRRHDALGMLVKHGEEVAVTRKQFGEKHGGDSWITGSEEGRTGDRRGRLPQPGQNC